MSYAEDMAKHAEDIKEQGRLWNVWQTTKSEEDKGKWWEALSSVHHRKYLTITMTIWPATDVDADKLKEMLENGSSNLPWINGNVYHEDQVVAEVVKAKASVWPKPAM